MEVEKTRTAQAVEDAASEIALHLGKTVVENAHLFSGAGFEIEHWSWATGVDLKVRYQNRLVFQSQKGSVTVYQTGPWETKLDNLAIKARRAAKAHRRQERQASQEAAD